jgi:DNA-binding NarL/FixJ family response regulator
MDHIRILIADDHPVFRFGLRALLNTQPDTEYVCLLAARPYSGSRPHRCRRPAGAQHFHYYPG